MSFCVPNLRQSARYNVVTHALCMLNTSPSPLGLTRTFDPTCAPKNGGGLTKLKITSGEPGEEDAGREEVGPGRRREDAVLGIGLCS